MRFFRFLNLLILPLLAVHAGLADGSPPNAAERACILALHTGGSAVAEAAAKNALRCLRLAQRGGLAPNQVQQCLANRSPAIARAQARTNAKARRYCGDSPELGPASAAAVNSAMAGWVDLRTLFGERLSAAAQTQLTAPRLAACQTVAADELVAVARAELSEYRNCVRRKLATRTLQSGADLQSCSGAASAPLNRARARASARLRRSCDSVPVEAAISGSCGAVGKGAALGACLAASARCGVCSAVNAADRSAASCHTFAEGVASFYCGNRPTTTQSVARQWNEQVLNAIRGDTPRPPVHARNLFHLSAAMYDAWSAYDGQAQAYFKAEHPVTANPADDRAIAISFAAYRVLTARYSERLAINHAAAKQSFDAQMTGLGLDPQYAATSGDRPAAVGNRIAAAVLAATLRDGANETGRYVDPNYTPVNQPLFVKDQDIVLSDATRPGYQLDPNRWQQLALDRIVTQNGIPLPGGVQAFIGPQWGSVAPFALTKAAPEALYLDPGPPPRLGLNGDADLRAMAVQLIRLSSQLTPDDPTLIDISPGAMGDNPLGSDAGTGYPVNPVTGQPYPPQWVKRADFGRVLAEYWADGPTSETPPGHWNALANAVADTPGFHRRLAGAGASLDPLEWDVKTYFALNAATHDAAIACWGAKAKYDSARPITFIRYMAKRGQSSSPALPSYHPDGLPLVPGLIELITAETAAPGGRHQLLVTPEAGGAVGEIAVLSWPGSPADPKSAVSGVRWNLGRAWMPYQRPTFVTPAFPGYYSGHSTFSRAAAEVLAALTGSEFFPGGLFEGFVAKKDSYLIHERGPSGDVRLQWASYFDAADQAGLSRLWGGIHPQVDDYTGRRVGQRIGQEAFAKAVLYFRGNR